MEQGERVEVEELVFFDVFLSTGQHLEVGGEELRIFADSVAEHDWGVKGLLRRGGEGAKIALCYLHSKLIRSL